MQIFVYFPAQLCGIQSLVGSRIGGKNQSGFEVLGRKSTNKRESPEIEQNTTIVCFTPHSFQENMSMLFKERTGVLQTSALTTEMKMILMLMVMMIMMVMVMVFQQKRDGSGPFYDMCHPIVILPSQKSQYLVKSSIYFLSYDQGNGYKRALDQKPQRLRLGH